ncbi:MAG TPA: hypothetical protein VE907_10850 [Gammaproteobacteria bacterium]|nr:hypothetical protein [Gammaproteobacteria bacterium]
MRLLTVLHHVFVWVVWARPIAQLAALAFVLSGCSLLSGGISAPPSYGAPSGGPMSFAPSSYRPSVYYLTNGVPHRVDREYVDRYACASGAALACICSSRLAETCDCRC